MLMFTDASHSNKPLMSGVGMILIDKHKEYNAGAYTNKCKDNNIAEVAAVAFGLKYCSDNKIFDKSSDKTLTILTDSAYTVQRIRDNTPPRTNEEEEYLNYIHNFMKTSKFKIKFLQIKGHVHDGTKFAYYNNVADQIAKEYRYLGIYNLEKDRIKQYKISKMKRQR